MYGREGYLKHSYLNNLAYIDQLTVSVTYNIYYYTVGCVRLLLTERLAGVRD